MRFDLFVRAIRRAARLSQRELAEATGVSKSVIERIESRRLEHPTFDAVERLAEFGGYRVMVVDRDGKEVDIVAEPFGDVRDRSGRQLPAHLNVRKIGNYFDGDTWWGWHHIAWYWLEPGDPTHTYGMRRRSDGSDADGVPDGLGLGERGES